MLADAGWPSIRPTRSSTRFSSLETLVVAVDHLSLGRRRAALGRLRLVPPASPCTEAAAGRFPAGCEHCKQAQNHRGLGHGNQPWASYADGLRTTVPLELAPLHPAVVWAASVGNLKFVTGAHTIALTVDEQDETTVAAWALLASQADRTLSQGYLGACFARMGGICPMYWGEQDCHTLNAVAASMPGMFRWILEMLKVRIDSERSLPVHPRAGGTSLLCPRRC